MYYNMILKLLFKLYSEIRFQSRKEGEYKDRGMNFKYTDFRIREKLQEQLGRSPGKYNSSIMQPNGGKYVLDLPSLGDTSQTLCHNFIGKK